MICGGPDADHRMIDTMLGRVAAGEPVSDVADDYGFADTPALAQYILDGYRRATEGWAHRVADVDGGGYAPATNRLPAPPSGDDDGE